MVDILKRVEETLEKGMTVLVEHPDIDGFEIEVAFIGRDEMNRLYNKCTQRKWNRQTRRVEDVTDRDKLLKLWADRVIKNWKGLTLGKLAKLLPIDLSSEDDPNSIVEAKEENKIALLRHNAEFDNYIMEIATNADVFMEQRKEKKAEVGNLQP